MDGAQRIQNTTVGSQEAESMETRGRCKGEGKEITMLSPVSKAGPDVKEVASTPQKSLAKELTDGEGKGNAV